MKQKFKVGDIIKYNYGPIKDRSKYLITEDRRVFYSIVNLKTKAEVHFQHHLLAEYFILIPKQKIINYPIVYYVESIWYANFIKTKKIIKPSYLFQYEFHTVECDETGRPVGTFNSLKDFKNSIGRNPDKWVKLTKIKF